VRASILGDGGFIPPQNMIFPDPTESYFAVLGVTIGCDDATLTARFQQLTRQFHPDKFATADDETQENALEATSLINNAYRTLKDPFTRAEYLLQTERNLKIDDLKGNPPQDIFMEVLEIQEGVMEYQETHDPKIKDALMVSKISFEARYEVVKSDLVVLFARWDSEADQHGALLDAMTDIIATRRYLRRVITNLENL
jgi:molecular chaperone HscB